MANKTEIIISAQDKTKLAFDSVKKSLDSLSGYADNFAGLVGGLGGLGAILGTTSFAAFAKSGIDTLDMLGDLSDRTGVAASTLSGFQLVAAQSDTSLEALGKGINKLSVFMADNAERARELGLSAKDPAEAFIQLSDVLSSITDNQKRASVANEVLGKSYQELLPALIQGGSALRNQIDAGKEYASVNEEMVKQAQKFNDQMDLFRVQVGNAGVSIGSTLLPYLNELADNFIINTKKSNLFMASLAAIGNAEKLAFLGTDIENDTKRQLELIEIIAKKKEDLARLDNQPASENRLFIRKNLQKNLSNLRDEYDAVSKRLEDNAAKEKLMSGATQNTTDAVLEQAKSFDELTKGLSIASVKMQELKDKQSNALESLLSGKINKTQFNEITDAIKKQQKALAEADKKTGNSTKRSGKSDTERAMEDAARFVESLQKQAATLDLSKSALTAYEAAHLKLNPAQKETVDGIVAEMQAREQAIEKNNQWLEQSDLMRQIIEEDVALVQGRQKSYEDMASQLTITNEDLNVDLITSDKERVQAQLDLEHARALDRIEAMGLEAEQAQDLIDKETEHYQLKQAEIEQGLKKTKTISEELGVSFKSAFEDAVVGGDKFSDVLQGIEQDIIRMAARKTVLDPLLKAFDQLLDQGKDAAKAGLFGDAVKSIFSIFTANANGNVYNSPSLSEFSGGVYNSPQAFAFANGAGIFAEAGPEAIMPLSRGADGKLGVKASGGSGVNMTVNLIESPGNGGQVNQSQEGNSFTLDIMVEKISGMMSRDITRGRGISGAIERQYGLNRAAGSY